MLSNLEVAQRGWPGVVQAALQAGMLVTSTVSTLAYLHTWCCGLSMNGSHKCLHSNAWFPVCEIVWGGLEDVNNLVEKVSKDH